MARRIPGRQVEVELAEEIAIETGESAALASMEAQLCALYAERERLIAALGTAEPEALIAMVQSLEAQLAEVYAAHERQAGADRG